MIRLSTFEQYYGYMVQQDKNSYRSSMSDIAPLHSFQFSNEDTQLKLGKQGDILLHFLLSELRHY